MQNDADLYEAKHVHDVYEQIASHFSSTRHKPWPLVTRFLESLPPGAIGLDLGCGNGKYLPVNPSVFVVASDRSANLLHIAQTQEGQHACVVADALALPHPGRRFDFVISIAAVHHLSTRERRREAVRGMLETLRAGGRALVYVWALEQKGSRRGWDEGDEQDVMVPWVLREKGSQEDAQDRVLNRYYHLYRAGELEDDVGAVGGRVLESGYERDNWWAIACP